MAKNKYVEPWPHSGSLINLNTNMKLKIMGLLTCVLPVCHQYTCNIIYIIKGT